jgi:hypothetical protein
MSFESRPPDLAEKHLNDREYVMRKLDMPAEFVDRYVNLCIKLAAPSIDQSGKSLKDSEQYSVWMVGVQYDGRPDDGPAWNLLLPAPDLESQVVYLLPTNQWVQIWFARVGPCDSPVFGEMRWRPGGKMSLDLRGLANPHKKADEVSARNAMKLLKQQIVEQGRPEMDRELAIKCYTLHEEGSTHAQIAESLGWEVYLDEYGVPRKSDRVARHIERGREIVMRENP